MQDVLWVSNMVDHHFHICGNVTFNTEWSACDEYIGIFFSLKFFKVSFLGGDHLVL